MPNNRKPITSAPTNTLAAGYAEAREETIRCVELAWRIPSPRMLVEKLREYADTLERKLDDVDAQARDEFCDLLWKIQQESPAEYEKLVAECKRRAARHANRKAVAS